MSGHKPWSEIKHKSTPDRVAAEKDRLEILLDLHEVIDRVESRGMAFQDEPWWSEFCALRDALRPEYGELD